MRGFTLAEIVIAAALVVLVLGALLSALSVGGGAVSRGMGSLDVLATTGLALEHLRHDLRLLVGPLPTVDVRSSSETALTFGRVEPVAPGKREARVTPVTYTYRRSDRRAELVRDVDGRRSVFGFDREVLFVADCTSGDRPGVRSVGLSFAFPSSRDRAEVRPRIAPTVVALNSPLLTLGARTSDEDRAFPATVPLPAADRPFAVDGSRPVEPVDELFPAESIPRQRR